MAIRFKTTKLHPVTKEPFNPAITLSWVNEKDAIEFAKERDHWDYVGQVEVTVKSDKVAAPKSTAEANRLEHHRSKKINQEEAHTYEDGVKKIIEGEQ